MPYDQITIIALAAELDKLLASGKVNKINAPSQSELTLVIRAGGFNRALYIGVAANDTRLHLTDEKFVTGVTPTAFCMLLRKHLVGATVQSVSTYACDRIIRFTFTARNELHDLAEFNLFVELTGGGGNIVLTDEKLLIMDCSRRMLGERNRFIVPSHTYVPPILSDKLNVFSDNLSELDTVDKTEIAQKLNGFSKETLRSALVLAEGKARVSDTLKSFGSLYDSTLFFPNVTLAEDGAPNGFHALRLPFDAGKVVPFDTLNEAINYYYSVAGATVKKQKETKELRVMLKRLITKTEKRLKENEERLRSAEDKERYKETGEILKCNAYKIKRGAEKVTLYDFYSDAEREIALNPTLSAEKNAEAYFKKYKKLKGAEVYATKERDELTAFRSYLASIEESILNSDVGAEYAEIQEELSALNFTKKSANSKVKKPKRSPILSFVIDGYTVYIGKNNIQNEEVTFNIATGGDIWLHAKNYHGSHGIIVRKNGDVPESVIIKAAEAVAYFSGARGQSKAEVDYTQRKFVKRAGRIGQVNYTHQKTAFVTPKFEE